MRVRPADTPPDDAVEIYLRRKGLFSWELVRIRLPQMLFEDLKRGSS
jgi:hypothetical protein